MSLQTLKEAARDLRISTDFLGESITIRRKNGKTVPVSAACRHKIRHEHDNHGNAEVIEELRVEIDRDALPGGFDYGDRVIRSGESEPYIYAYNGSHTSTSWKGVFERRRITASGRAQT